MDIVTLVAIALGLSFDTFAVSLACGVVNQRISFRAALKVAFFMALFQGTFTVAGYFAGSVISSAVSSVDHWIAFALLSFLGVRMIVNGIEPGLADRKGDITSLPSIVTMAVGTSIDALAVGVSFALLNINIWIAGFLIALVTFIASMTAIRLGKAARNRTGSRVEILGGLILIAIGVKILLEHLPRYS
ncbi:MAG: manganese efflux pump [Bacteroidetes bacterium]|nr:manganese efflux pump [Bacteroidota bacterium]